FKYNRHMNGVYAVYDLGGGTFDISVIRTSGQDVEVIATNGIAKLGGDDFDVAIQRIVSQKFKEQTAKDLGQDQFTKNEAEEENKRLSTRQRVTIRAARCLIDVTRDEFEEAISSLVTQAEMLCEATLEEANISVADLNGVLLSGGSTRVPLVLESIKRTF